MRWTDDPVTTTLARRDPLYRLSPAEARAIEWGWRSWQGTLAARAAARRRRASARRWLAALGGTLVLVGAIAGLVWATVTVAWLASH